MNEKENLPNTQIGWVPIFRSIMEEEIWSNKPSSWFKIYMYIVFKVNHTDSNLCKKGQGYFNFSQAIDNNRIGKDITSNMVDNCIKWLKQTEQIVAKKSTRGMYITVVNYEKFCVVDQVDQIEKKTTKDGIETESKQNQNDTIYNNDNNGKNIKINTGIDPDIDNHNFKRGQGIESLRDMVNKIKIKDIDPKNLIKYEWQEKAQRYASDLSINLGSWESRWFRFFKEVKGSHIETAYQYLKDHPKNLTDEEKIKMFFKISQTGLKFKQGF